MKFLSIRRIKAEITQAETPPRITALSMAVGVSLAFGPLPGLHLILGFLIAKVCRLNPVVILVGILIHNPWTMLPIHLLGLIVGDLLLYRDVVSLDQFRAFPWDEVTLTSLFSGEFWHAKGRLLGAFWKPFVVGSSAMAALTGFASYQFTLRLVRSRPEVTP